MSHLKEVGKPARPVGRTERVPGVRATLARALPFSTLDRSALDGLEEVCTSQDFPRRKPLHLQEAAAEAVFVLARGRARVVRRGNADRVLTVAYRAPGDLLGESALGERMRYEDTATATEQVRAVRVPLRHVDTLLNKNPDFARAMLQLVLQRRVEAERRIESLLSRTVESRVSEFLLDAAERHGIPDSRGILIGVKYTHQEIADYVGSTRETVTLTLGELKRRGLVEFDHRRVVVTDRDALQGLT